MTEHHCSGTEFYKLRFADKGENNEAIVFRFDDNRSEL